MPAPIVTFPDVTSPGPDAVNANVLGVATVVMTQRPLMEPTAGFVVPLMMMGVPGRRPCDSVVVTVMTLGVAPLLLYVVTAMAALG